MKLRAITTVEIFGFALLLIAGACSHPISKQLRNEAQTGNTTFVMVLKDPAACKGKIVLWGGKIIETTNIKDGTEMLVLETPVDFLGTPAGAQSSQGRFIALSPQFLDPAIYTAERAITLAGEVMEPEERALGKTTYQYPVVMIKELYLWEMQYSADHHWYDPWVPYYYGPGPYYYHEADHEGPHHGGDGHHR